MADVKDTFSFALPSSETVEVYIVRVAGKLVARTAAELAPAPPRPPEARVRP